ncbi:hypothetical protein pb186bvf_003196 [Paramecium bursaria]
MVPCYDQINVIDDRLKQLQEEVQLMEKEYGFNSKHKQIETKPTKEKENKTQSQQGLSQQLQQTKPRYNNLTSIIDSDSQKKLKNQPQLSQKWVEIFKEKPSLMQFYDAERWLPKFQPIYDIIIKPTPLEENTIFEDYANKLE